MGFKGKSTIIDLKLELGDTKGVEHTIIPSKAVDAKAIREFTNLQLESVNLLKNSGVVLSQDKEEMNANVMKAVESGDLTTEKLNEVIDQQVILVDFWYEKGVDFWKDNFSQSLTIEVLGYINEQIIDKKK